MTNKPKILCPCPIPKRLLTSNHWIARNDSSNVNSILQPDNFLFSPRLKYHEKTKGDVIIRKLLSENNCYCRRKCKNLPKPSYFKRPNSCVGLRENLTGENVEDDDLRRKPLACVCEEVDGDDEDSVGAKRRLNLRHFKSLPTEVNFKPTEQRNKYEEYRQMQEEKFREKLLEDKESEEFERFNSEYSSREKNNSAGGDSNIDTILSTRKYGTNTSESQFTNKKYSGLLHAKSSSDNNHNNFKGEIRSAPDFRKEHYFETHNIGKIGDITGNPSRDDHKCVHQFRLDDRWIPEPLNTDPFGRSICKICDKVMEGSRISLSSGYFHTESDRLSRSKIKNYAESYKSGFTPTTINLGRGKSKIEVVLKDKDIDKFGNYINRVKRPVYRNSLALRHQRLRMI